MTEQNDDVPNPNINPGKESDLFLSIEQIQEMRNIVGGSLSKYGNSLPKADASDWNVDRMPIEQKFTDILPRNGRTDGGKIYIQKVRQDIIDYADSYSKSDASYELRSLVDEITNKSLDKLSEIEKSDRTKTNISLENLFNNSPNKGKPR